MKIYVTMFGNTIATVHDNLISARYCSNHSGKINILEISIDPWDSIEYDTLEEEEYRELTKQELSKIREENDKCCT